MKVITVLLSVGALIGILFLFSRENITQERDGYIFEAEHARITHTTNTGTYSMPIDTNGVIALPVFYDHNGAIDPEAPGRKKAQEEAWKRFSPEMIKDKLEEQKDIESHNLWLTIGVMGGFILIGLGIKFL